MCNTWSHINASIQFTPVFMSNNILTSKNFYVYLFSLDEMNVRNKKESHGILFLLYFPIKE